MTETTQKPENQQLLETIESVQNALEDTKAEKLVVYHLKNNVVCDAVIVATSNNPNHSRAMMRSVKAALEDNASEEETTSQSNDQSDGWAVVDLNTIMIHILNKDMREFYEIDAWFAEKADQVVHL